MSHQFDELAKDLARGVSRRQALRRFGEGLAGTLLASLGLESAWAKPGDPGGGNSDCAHFCNAVYPPGSDRGHCKSDAAHGQGLCTQCGPAAPAGHGPVCGVQASPFCCNSGESCCDNAYCSNLKTDLANCGACHNVCPDRAHAVRTCTGGVCGYTCLAGFGDCDASADNGCETNLLTDVGHCGACSTACPTPANAMATCVRGQCGFVCNPGFADCDQNPTNGCEVNLLTDANNCGGCNNHCTGGKTCQVGTCACPAGQYDSNGLCCPNGTSNSSGVCCPTGTTNCSGACVNLSTDPNNCNTCGTPCSAPANATPTCVGGTCGFVCNAGYSYSNGICCPNSTPGHVMANCGGTCVDLSTDPNNCNTCGNRCATGQSCVGGTCSGGGCPPGTTNCGGACVDTSGDANNCGACGNRCPVSATCIGGTCVCPYPYTISNGNCCRVGEYGVVGTPICCPIGQILVHGVGNDCGPGCLGTGGGCCDPGSVCSAAPIVPGGTYCGGGGICCPGTFADGSFAPGTCPATDPVCCSTARNSRGGMGICCPAGSICGVCPCC